MITNSAQNWSIGAQVKVGFMSLKVLAAVPTPGDYAPDAYLLGNLAGDRFYKFVPHSGIEKITRNEFAELASCAPVAA